MQTKTLSERIEELNRLYKIKKSYEFEPTNNEFFKAMKVIEELQAENEALLAKNKELEEELQERKAYIVANPCAQCGGRINAMKCDAWAKKAKELEEKLKNNLQEEDGKIKSGRGIAEYTPSDFMKHMERCEDAIKNMPKQEPKWLPMSSAPKCGSPITVNQSTNKRHKIFKANWSLNKWYSLYEEGNNEEVYPEFWLEGSKEEPQIDMKKESVEPVSIWKDNKDELKKLEKQNEKFLIRTKDGRVIMPIISNYFSSDNQIDKNIKEATTLTDFINSFEQERLKRLDMEARLRKLEGK